MEPFKEFINRQVIDTLGDVFKRVHPEFEKGRYVKLATHQLDALELKQRVVQVASALDQTLPTDFDALCPILLASLHPSEDTAREEIKFSDEGACGWAVWPLTALVAMRGLDHPELALSTLREMTKRSTAEFDVRPFLDQHTDVSLAAFQDWTNDPNRHVRRLASEGSRPRLPWGMRLQKFVDAPEHILPILEALKDDPEEYVRRSVANSLNDVAKDHPDLVADIAADWLKGASKDRRRLVKHACRTLIKQGHEKTLASFGYMPIEPTGAELRVTTPVVQYGGVLEFELGLSGIPTGTGLMIDYAIHFVKANGKRAPKVFKWKDLPNHSGGQLSATRKHAIKPITTRVYYPGKHLIEVLVNGRAVTSVPFELRMD